MFTRPDDCNPTATSESKYCKDGIDVSNFLNLNSLEKHDEFCLSYMFTNRDFMHGTLGLAWVGASDCKLCVLFAKDFYDENLKNMDTKCTNRMVCI